MMTPSMTRTPIDTPAIAPAESDERPCGGVFSAVTVLLAGIAIDAVFVICEAEGVEIVKLKELNMLLALAAILPNSIGNFPIG